MIEMRRAQLSFGDGLIATEVSDLREDWMTHADEVLADEQLVATVFEALARRRPKSRSRGRKGTPAEMVLRLLILKHVRNWSYDVLEREVRANLVYRDFTRVGGAKMPDAKTMGRWGLALGPQVIKQIHERIVRIAQAKEVTRGRRMRVDTTVTETNIHYPTDSSLLGDGVRVLIRTMKKITKIAGEDSSDGIEVPGVGCGPQSTSLHRLDCARRAEQVFADITHRDAAMTRRQLLPPATADLGALADSLGVLWVVHFHLPEWRPASQRQPPRSLRSTAEASSVLTYSGTQLRRWRRPSDPCCLHKYRVEVRCPPRPVSKPSLPRPPRGWAGRTWCRA